MGISCTSEEQDAILHGTSDWNMSRRKHDRDLLLMILEHGMIPRDPLSIRNLKRRLNIDCRTPMRHARTLSFCPSRHLAVFAPVVCRDLPIGAILPQAKSKVFQGRTDTGSFPDLMDSSDYRAGRLGRDLFPCSSLQRRQPGPQVRCPQPHTYIDSPAYSTQHPSIGHCLIE